MSSGQVSDSRHHRTRLRPLQTSRYRSRILHPRRYSLPCKAGEGWGGGRLAVTQTTTHPDASHLKGGCHAHRFIAPAAAVRRAGTPALSALISTLVLAVLLLSPGGLGLL